MTSKMKINAINIMSNLQVDERDDADLLNIYLLYYNLFIVPIVTIIGDGENKTISYNESYIYFTKQTINSLLFNIIEQLYNNVSANNMGVNSLLHVLLDIDFIE